VLPFLPEPLPVDDSVNGIIAKIGMYCLDSRMHLYGCEWAKRVEKIQNCPCEDCMHRSAGEAKPYEFVLRFPDNGLETPPYSASD
jgi:hypothetical protein